MWAMESSGPQWAPGQQAGCHPHRPGSPGSLEARSLQPPPGPHTWLPSARGPQVHPKGLHPSRMGPWSLNSSTREAAGGGRGASRPCAPDGPRGPRSSPGGRVAIPASSSGSRKSAPRPEWQDSPDVSKSKPVTLDFAGRRGCPPGLVTPILEMVLAQSMCVLVHSKATGGTGRLCGAPGEAEG